MFLGVRVVGECTPDLVVYCRQVHHDCHKDLSRVKQRLKILWVSLGVSPILPFRVDIRVVGECVGFSSQVAQTVFNHEVEARKKFRPVGLLSG